MIANMCFTFHIVGKIASRVGCGRELLVKDSPFWFILNSRRNEVSNKHGTSGILNKLIYDKLNINIILISAFYSRTRPNLPFRTSRANFPTNTPCTSRDILTSLTIYRVVHEIHHSQTLRQLDEASGEAVPYQESHAYYKPLDTRRAESWKGTITAPNICAVVL